MNKTIIVVLVVVVVVVVVVVASIKLSIGEFASVGGVRRKRYFVYLNNNTTLTFFKCTILVSWFIIKEFT